MLAIIWILIIVIAELIAPEYVAVLIAIANIFIPDQVFLIDEVLGIVIAIKRIAN